MLSSGRRHRLHAHAIAALATLVVISGATADAAAARNRSSAPTWLDRGTASVLADDIGFDHFCDADCSVSLRRCYRVDALRVDCVMTLELGSDFQHFVIATALVGNLLHFGDYWIPGHPRVTRALIQRWPAGFWTRPIARWYAQSAWTRSGYKVFRPNRLASRHVGYGTPHLKATLRRQCQLQPRLRCSLRP